MGWMKEQYKSQVSDSLVKRFNFTSNMQVPRLKKIVLNMCLSEATSNRKVLDLAVAEMTQIAGQKPQLTKAKKAISNFKLREGQAIGCAVTLRNERMWSFLERLTAIALPRARDFRGLSPKGFDGRGNFNLGLKEQIAFPEVNYDKVDKVRGMNITICTSAKTDDEGRALLEELGLPFRKK